MADLVVCLHKHHCLQKVCKMKIIALYLFLFSLIFIRLASAHCPLCTAATGAAVATARWFGVDDLIVGTFFGGFIISSSLWFNNILKKKNKGKEFIVYQSWLIILFSLATTIFAYYTLGLLSLAPPYVIFGIDKILLGTMIGSFATLFAFYFHEFLRKINGNKNYIPFQVIILSLFILSLISTGYYLFGWI